MYRIYAGYIWAMYRPQVSKPNPPRSSPWHTPTAASCHRAAPALGTAAGSKAKQQTKASECNVSNGYFILCEHAHIMPYAHGTANASSTKYKESK